ncbi:hypothetical protein BDZ97DRAFT_772755 [Flammula alnicola]|nr:hypothetical protein BDZ97DRAFT_772755 [Flammula alnicola]
MASTLPRSCCDDIDIWPSSWRLLSSCPPNSYSSSVSYIFLFRVRVGLYIAQSAVMSGHHQYYPHLRRRYYASPHSRRFSCLRDLHIDIRGAGLIFYTARSSCLPCLYPTHPLLLDSPRRDSLQIPCLNTSFRKYPIGSKPSQVNFSFLPINIYEHRSSSYRVQVVFLFSFRGLVLFFFFHHSGYYEYILPDAEMRIKE